MWQMSGRHDCQTAVFTEPQKWLSRFRRNLLLPSSVQMSRLVSVRSIRSTFLPVTGDCSTQVVSPTTATEAATPPFLHGQPTRRPTANTLLQDTYSQTFRQQQQQTHTSDATSKQDRHHGKELGNVFHTCCLSKRCGWPAVQSKNTIQQGCVTLEKVTSGSHPVSLRTYK